MSTHPGSITYVDADAKTEKVEPIDGVPEQLRFAEDENGQQVPVVKVVAQLRGENERIIVEYGPANQELRRTIQRK